MRGLFLVVGNPQPPAQVEIADIHPLFPEQPEKVFQPLQCVDEGRYLRQLGSDVAADPLDLQPGHFFRLPVFRQRFLNIDAELVFLEARRNVGMGLRIDIRIDPECNAGLQAQLFCAGVNLVQLLGRLDIEHQDAGLQGVFDFIRAFSHPGIDHPAGIDTRLQGAEQLAAGHDIHASPFRGENPQDSDIGIGLDGKTDDVRNFREGVVEDAKMVPQRPVTVKIKRGPHFFGNAGNGHVFAPELRIPVMKVMHGR